MREILVADDNDAYRDGIATMLELEGYSVRTAADGAGALAIFRERRPDLVLLDVMMPGLNGYAVCTQIRAEDPDVPVMFLTEKTSEVDVLRGFGIGADDYMAKSVPEQEKLARIGAVLRRCRRPATDSVADFRFGDWRVDVLASALVGRDGRRVELTVKELEILRYLQSHPGEVVSRDFLVTRFWGIDFDGDERSLTIALSRLREKLGPSGRAIRTVRGQGYSFIGP